MPKYTLKASDFNVAQIVINDVRMNIKKMLLDDTLPPDNMSARSATEVVQRRNELAQNLGAAFGRLITEAMIPIVKRVLFIMDQTGLIDMPLKVNGGEVKIVPISPLAQAQNMDELNDVMQFAQIVAGMGPEAMITIKRDEIIDYVAERLGVPARLLTTQEEREQIAQQALSFFQQAPSIGVVYGDALLFGERSGYSSVGPFNLQRLMLSNYIDACALFRRSCWEKVGGYDEQRAIMMWSDWDFWLRLAFEGYRYQYVPMASFSYRLLSHSMVHGANRDSYLKAAAYFYKRSNDH